jgi:hypothetical protein
MYRARVFQGFSGQLSFENNVERIADSKARLSGKVQRASG